MNENTKEIKIGDNVFSIVLIEPWVRLAFIADLQKEFLLPLLKNTGTDDLNTLFGGDNNGQIDVLTLLMAFSNSLDGPRIEKWTRRILSEGMVVYARTDGQRAKLSFGELNKIFTHPVQIIQLLKEAIGWNLAGFDELINTFAPESAATVKEQ